MSSTPIPPVDPESASLLHHEILEERLDAEPDADADLDEDVRAGQDPLDGAAVSFESDTDAEEPDGSESTPGTITVMDATPEALGFEVQGDVRTDDR